MTSSAEPFRISLQDGVVLVDRFSSEIDRYYVDLERELPIVRDAVARLVAEGYTWFILDLRTASPTTAYPIAKWGGMYGALQGLRRQHPEAEPAKLAGNVKLVGSGELLREPKVYRFDLIFECCTTVEQARAALSEAAQWD